MLGVHAFIYKEGAFTPEEAFTLVDLSGPRRALIPVTYATGINDAGDIVGGYNEDDETRRGFILRDGVYSPFDVPGSGLTDVYAINNAGELVGEYLDVDGLIYGFLFNPDRGFRRLAGTGNPRQRFTWLVPFGLNDSGQVAGSGATAAGSMAGFVAEPPTGWLSEPILFSRVR